MAATEGGCAKTSRNALPSRCFLCAGVIYEVRTRAKVYRTHACSPRTASDFVGAKRIAQPHQSARFERNHVETARGLIMRTPAAGCQVMTRGMHDPLLLLPADARCRAAIMLLRTRANFDEHQRAVTVTHHQIDFTAPAQHVARDETQTLALQKLHRTRLESRADEFGPGWSRKVVAVGPRTHLPTTRFTRRCVAQWRPRSVCLRLLPHD